MYIKNDIVNFRLDELKALCSIVSYFDKTTANRLDDLYNYHKNMLHEGKNHWLRFSLKHENNYNKKFHFKTVLQPEFTFSENICVQDLN